MPPFHCGPQSSDSFEDIFDESDHYWVFSEKKRFDIKNSDDASFTEELMANNIKTCKTSN